MAAERYLNLVFPKGGIDVSQAFVRQSAKPGPNGEQPLYTTPLGINVRGMEALTLRNRGGSRSGLSKYIADAVVADWIVQSLQIIVGTYDDPSGGDVQTSQLGRVVTIVAVSQGDVYVASPGDTSWTTTTNSSSNTPPLSFSGVIFSAANNQKLYFADGSSTIYYIPATNVVNDWTLTAGTFPVDGSGNYPRLICTWRGRTVQSGLLEDPQNWFMSRTFDPHDYDYGAAVEDDPTIAIAGNNSDAGLIGDVITALIPYTDDMLIFGGDHTIYIMRGDPMAGGTIDRISDAIGMAFGEAWCKDPVGNVYFFSNQCRIFTFQPGRTAPIPISEGIDPLLREVNTGENSIRLIWDDRFEGFYVFITPLTAAAAATHYFLETKTGAWWIVRFKNKKHNPLTCVTLDGNLPSDRVPIIGSWDGYVRALDPTALDDDGEPIESEVWYGPFLTPNFDEVMIEEAQAVMGLDSGPVNYSVHVGRTAEEALAASGVVPGTWEPGRNLVSRIKRAGHAVYFRVTADEPWAMEAIRLSLPEVLPKYRRRN